MRDAFGGVFMIRLYLVFIVIYVGFTAISLNYAKAFRIKNHIIDVIEESQVENLDKLFPDSKNTKIDAILKDAKYRKTCGDIDIDEGYFEDKDGNLGYCYKGIVVINSGKASSSNNYTQTYQVIAYNDWNLGVLNMILTFGGQNAQDPITGRWAIQGEAKVVVRKTATEK